MASSIDDYIDLSEDLLLHFDGFPHKNDGHSPIHQTSPIHCFPGRPPGSADPTPAPFDLFSESFSTMASSINDYIDEGDEEPLKRNVFGVRILSQFFLSLILLGMTLSTKIRLESP